MGGCEVATEWVKRQVLWCDLFGEVVTDTSVVGVVRVYALGVY